MKKKKDLFIKGFTVFLLVVFLLSTFLMFLVSWLWTSKKKVEYDIYNKNQKEWQEAVNNKNQWLDKGTLDKFSNWSWSVFSGEKDIWTWEESK